MPFFWGNRNWHPLLGATLEEITERGFKHVLAFTTSAYSSYSSCRQYIEDIERARTTVGAGAPIITKVPSFCFEPGFISANVSRIQDAIKDVATEDRKDLHLAFTAHSIPAAMGTGCDYERQLNEVARIIANELQLGHFKVVFQSRSGPPTQAWLEPDICDHIRHLHEQGVKTVVVSPIGFVSDHMEVIYDLDVEALQLSKELGLRMLRAGTVGIHPDFVSMLADILTQHLDGTRPAELCQASCCPSGRPAGVPERTRG